ncbi:hypothetical protein D3C80_1195700 [compost metagenome]
MAAEEVAAADAACELAATGRAEADLFRAQAEGQRAQGIGLRLPAGADCAAQAVGLADKVGNEGCARVFVEAVGVIDLGDAPGFHHHYPVADRQGLGLVVGDHQGGDADLVLDATYLELHFFTQVGVQVGQRFVQQQHRRFDHQCAGQGYTLALAAGQFTRVAFGVLVQAYQRQRLVDAPSDLGVGHLAHAQAEGNVVAHGHVREQRVALEHHTQAPAGRLGVGDVAAVEDDAATGDLDEASNHLQGGGLAAARRAEQGDKLAFFDGQ